MVPFLDVANPFSFEIESSASPTLFWCVILILLVCVLFGLFMLHITSAKAKKNQNKEQSEDCSKQKEAVTGNIPDEALNTSEQVQKESDKD